MLMGGVVNADRADAFVWSSCKDAARKLRDKFFWAETVTGRP
ncbi:hypothetical protein ACGFZL_11340 [Streptomyces sp. NPDC048182]